MIINLYGKKETSLLAARKEEGLMNSVKSSLKVSIFVGNPVIAGLLR